MGRRLAVLLATGTMALSVPALAEPLRLERVMLSTGGVGYFEWSAAVDGNATLDLDVPLDQVDDVLKSLVVFDDKGSIGGLELPGQEPLAQLFRDLPFGADALDSTVALLNALQGAAVEVDGSRALRGRLVKVEPEQTALPGGLGATTRHRVTVLTDDGLQQLVLEEVEALKFTDEAIAAQVERALEIVAQSHAKDRRSLKLHSTGDGSRVVRVAYVVQAPLWKTAYRLTLDPTAGAATAALQGWAVIENMSGQDWKDVELTLVSGSPVTFRQALYATYYVERPEIPVEVVGHILPGVDTGASSYKAMAEGSGAGAAQLRSMAADGMPPPPPPMVAAAPSPRPEMAGGAVEVAEAEALTQVVYTFGQKVSVGAGQSLSVPIVNRKVPAERLSVYQPEVHAVHPLASVRLTNDGNSGLPPGLLTLYEAAPGLPVRYVGDARLAALPAGEQRLVSYALDQKTRIDAAQESSSIFEQGSFSKGVFTAVSRAQQRYRYKIVGPAREDRKLVIEIPKLYGFALTAPETGVEENDRVWRLGATVGAGQVVEVAATAERPLRSSQAVSDLNDGQIAYYSGLDGADPALKAQFETLAGLRRTVADKAQEGEALASQVDALVEEQSRLRDNLAAIPKDSDLYRRYLKKLDDQETAIETLQAGIAKARDEAAAARQALGDYIATL